MRTRRMIERLGTRCDELEEYMDGFYAAFKDDYYTMRLLENVRIHKKPAKNLTNLLTRIDRTHESPAQALHAQQTRVPVLVDGRCQAICAPWRCAGGVLRGFEEVQL